MKVVPLCTLAAVLIVMTLLHAAVHDPKPLRITVTPTISFEPTAVQIQVRLQPDKTDRWISVATDNGYYRRSSGFTIEPDRTLYAIGWRDIPAGKYLIIVGVGHGADARATATAPLTVIARD